MISEPGADNELVCSEGTWAADLAGAQLYRAPASLSYQWLLGGTEIAGKTEATLTPTEDGEYSCRVSATNYAGSSSQSSAARAVTLLGDPTAASLELSLASKPKQKHKYLKLQISCGVSCDTEIKGKAIVPGKSRGKASTALKKRHFHLKPKTVAIGAGEIKTLKLPFIKHKKRTNRISQKMNRYKVAAKRSKLIVKVKASNSSGKPPKAKQKIWLKR